MTEDQLQVRGLSCVRGNRRLFRDVSFVLQSGEWLHVQGPNGAGKTTLLRTICGLLAPDQGHVLWNGQGIFQTDHFYQQLLYIGHRLAVKRQLSALENLRIALALRGLRPADNLLWQALDTAGLRGFEYLPVKFLSQGQVRRIALAWLASSPARIWILDELFNGLDDAAITRFEAMRVQHIHSGGMMVATTHQAPQWSADQTVHLGM